MSKEYSIIGITRKGSPATMKIQPAPSGMGIVFNSCIRAAVRYAAVKNHCTVLRRGKHNLAGVEHFLAACTGLGITDLTVRLNNQELPFGDGSSRLFVPTLLKLGSANQGAPAMLTEPVAVCAANGIIIALPAPRLVIHCLIDYPLTGKQFFSCQINPHTFIREIAPARTFGPAEPELKHLLRHLHFRVKNVDGWLFPARLRFPNEPCRHKILDLLGDLALLGRQIRAEIFAFNPSHRLNIKFVRRLKHVASGVKQIRCG
jgi:UDP-3-O-[3-hydroxymyristoyl] N-acetylglucosamine deacetylase